MRAWSSEGEGHSSSSSSHRLNAILGFASSIWTIDIAYLLHKHGLRMKLYTNVLGADAGHAAKVAILCTK